MTIKEALKECSKHKQTKLNKSPCEKCTLYDANNMHWCKLENYLKERR